MRLAQDITLPLYSPGFRALSLAQDVTLPLYSPGFRALSLAQDATQPLYSPGFRALSLAQVVTLPLYSPGFRAFSRASTRARSHRSRGGKNQDRDRDGSAYRQSGTISEASYDSEVDSRVVLGEKEQNKLNELSEKQLKEGLKNSGGKCMSFDGTMSPRPDTNRTRALTR